MSCCQCVGIESMFDEKAARKDLKRYLKKGPRKTTRMLLKPILEGGVKNGTLLDIGGGVGIIQHELFANGIRSGVSIDGSSAYLTVARKEAVRRGYADKIVYRHGDFTQLANDTGACDVVTLDRVICCYDDMPDLVNLSSALAKRYYGVVYLRDEWWVKLIIPVLNLYPKLKKCPFRVFVHSTEEVEKIINNNGLKKKYYGTSFVWQVAVFERSGSES